MININDLIEARAVIDELIAAYSYTDEAHGMGLTPIEYALFKRLSLVLGQPVSRTDLMLACERVRNRRGYMTRQSFQVHIYRLREKAKGFVILRERDSYMMVKA